MNRQFILIIILLIAVVATALVFYFNYYQNSSETTAPITQEPRGRLAELRRIKNLDLDTPVLKDPKFVSLEEFSVEAQLKEDSVPGRPNPFLPF